MNRKKLITSNVVCWVYTYRGSGWRNDYVRINAKPNVTHMVFSFVA
ncbi:hypothetical protein O9992_00810 [Vibrio lentus]|nr:hypothetical protein [Vibrio lentus]